MAKQTFTTGQVLTAAQMTSLQQTAMGGGSATTKTASYVLVAADAGTTVTMTSASATTITVNTSLFAAGDTVYIQNLGAGVSTITAGSATVNTSASLALAQYEGGQLYFTSTSASIFVKGAGASGAFTLIASGTLSGTALALASIPQTYETLVLYLNGITVASGSPDISLRMNNNSASAYNALYANTNSATWTSAVSGTSILLAGAITGANRMVVNFENYATGGVGYPIVNWLGMGTLSATQRGFSGFGTMIISTSLTTINIDSTVSLTGGTYELYGVK